MKEIINVLIGYASIFAYIFIMIFGVGKLIQKRFDTETSRKIIHISLFMVWVFIDLFLKNSIHQIIIPICFLILNAISFKSKMFKSIERESGNHLGTIYFAIAITAIMTLAYFKPVLFPYTGVAVFALTFGDGFAALVGHHTKSKKIYRSKSILGFVACFVATFISVLAFKYIYSLQISILNVFVLALICAILELVCFGLDNFFITFGILLASYYLSVSGSAWFYGSVYIAVAIFVIVFFSGAIDYFGSLASMVIVFCFSFFGGYLPLAFLLITYFIIFAIGIVSRLIKKEKKERKPRGLVQILVNGGIGTILLLLSYHFNSLQFQVGALIVIAGCFVDSVSSDVGTLSRKRPYDPIRKARVEPGTSGGMTVLGTFSAVVASFLCALLICWVCNLKWFSILIFAPLIFLQTIIDTILGSTVQAKYVCDKCGKKIEKPTHCGRSAIYKSGVKFINNDMVNLISSLILTLFAMGLLMM